MIWEEESEQVQKVELASHTPLVQSLSMNLYQNAAVVAKVEAWISELGAVPQGPSSLRLRDAVTWEVIARVDHGRNSYQAVQRVCPEHCVEDTVRSSPTPQAALLLMISQAARAISCFKSCTDHPTSRTTCMVAVISLLLHVYHSE